VCFAEQIIEQCVASTLPLGHNTTDTMPQTL
jgi:hypothetical protein